MEYVQMTLNDWLEMKQKLKRELLGVKQSFVRIGYALRQIEERKLYEQDGYRSVAEFAKAEYGMEPSTTSRFMSINREYSIDGYSETLRPEFADLGRSQLEEMLKLPESDRTMIQPETPRQDIRSLKQFNKVEPAAGVADDIHQMVEKFYKDNPDVLNAVFEKAPFTEQTVKQFAEIVNPGGNRSYKKGIYFLMMYENRIAVKKFGENPQDMTWWEFCNITMEIFGSAAAGSKTWQAYFGDACDAEDDNGRVNTQQASDDKEPEQNQGDETETQKSITKDDDTEADSGANNAEDKPENKKEDMEHNEADDAADAEKREHDTDGTGKSDNKENAGRKTVNPERTTRQKKEIAPAQKSAESLEKEASDEVKNGEKNRDKNSNAERNNTEPKAGEAAGKETNETEPDIEAVTRTEVIEKTYGSRKDYIDTLTVHGLAFYMAAEFKRNALNDEVLASLTRLEAWLMQEVDENGQEVE